MDNPRKYFGLFHRKECLLPTWRALGIFFIVGCGTLWFAFLNVHAFLALNQPIKAEILVVEGWLPDYALKASVTEFRRGNYRKLYVTGGPLDQGSELASYRSYAELGVAILRRMGLDDQYIVAVPAPLVQKDRTFASAIALKQVLHESGDQIQGINLVSLGVHSRRSRLLFQSAFDHDVQVGIISIENVGYPFARWWEHSAGMRDVMGELLAYLYAALIFPVVQH